jgi:hypothetical protein
LSGIAAVIIHLLILVVLATSQWGSVTGGRSGEAELIAIGPTARQLWHDNSNNELESTEAVSSFDEHASDSLEDEMHATSILGPQSGEPVILGAFSSDSAGPHPLDMPTAKPSPVNAEGEGDFGNLISRLQKDGLDIVITFDSTGSMQGEIDQVKSQIGRIGSALFQLVPKTRIGICTYRDYRDSYVVKGLPLSDNLAEVVLFLEDIEASGGGDKAEAVEQGLRWSIEKNQFHRQARKVILLFGDAPPRGSALLTCEKLASDFRKQGGIVSTVTCRSDRRLDEFVAIARIGRGESFLTRNEREIMAQLMVLVFGSKHRGKVVEAFNLLAE